MPRAHAQPSPGDEKPSNARRIKKEMQASTRSCASHGGFAPPPTNRDFDLWLRRELGRMHGDVLHEPIPEKLLRIIEEGVAAGD